MWLRNRQGISAIKKFIVCEQRIPPCRVFEECGIAVIFVVEKFLAFRQSLAFFPFRDRVVDGSIVLGDVFKCVLIDCSVNVEQFESIIADKELKSDSGQKSGTKIQRNRFVEPVCLRNLVNSEAILLDTFGHDVLALQAWL